MLRKQASAGEERKKKGNKKEGRKEKNNRKIGNRLSIFRNFDSQIL
jgi:hypothetical protein